MIRTAPTVWSTLVKERHLSSPSSACKAPIGFGQRGTYGQGYLGFAKMYLELLELLLELLLQLLLELLLELLLLLLLFSLPRTW